MIALIVVSALLAASLTANLVLFLSLRKKPKRAESVELQEFLGDLLGGVGIVAISRIDPTSILLRSPKR